ncbi:branched-chain amino acid ABC transporter permease [Ramlibacter tataouinensis]|uniref:branched-chain amino acid ABC transporter permease n=1 Tax=Ramlibacter tataouinensis TaxID=94132 RepID=UPI0022F3DB7A|nr:branched-chain amino acid ABC transporter permease [Ramlibacter tataouinensis]WBY03082.1 branched-chain amino acid ABC transporter permease [Ramlibacter tataouinensis]
MNSVAILIQQVGGGVATGVIYGLVALALVVIYQATEKINFAQGEMAMFSTFSAWAMIQAGLPYWVAFSATIAGSFALGALIERFVIRGMAKAPVLSVVIVFIGLMLVFNSLAGLLFGHTMREFPSPFQGTAWLQNGIISAHRLGSILVCLLLLAGIYGFFAHTRYGLAMRAAAVNPASSMLCGIPVPLMYSLGWGGAAAVGAVAGMMVAPVVFLDTHMMSGVLLYAFAGALLGGITNPWGALLGGILMGVGENLLGAYLIGSELKMTFALLVLVAVLLLRPQGLLGKTIVTRV